MPRLNTARRGCRGHPGGVAPVSFERERGGGPEARAPRVPHLNTARRGCRATLVGLPLSPLNERGEAGRRPAHPGCHVSTQPVGVVGPPWWLPHRSFKREWGRHKACPLQIEASLSFSTLLGKGCPRPTVCNDCSPFSILHSQFSILHSPFTIHHSPFTIHHSPFTILHSPFSILHSPFSILIPF